MQTREHSSGPSGTPFLALNYPKPDLPHPLTRDEHSAVDHLENQCRTSAQPHVAYIPAQQAPAHSPQLVSPPPAVGTWSILFPAAQQPGECGINPCLFCKARLGFPLGHLLNSWSAPCIQGNLSQPAAYREASIWQVSPRFPWCSRVKILGGL